MRKSLLLTVSLQVTVAGIVLLGCGLFAFAIS
jgi:hypothetical protein